MAYEDLRKEYDYKRAAMVDKLIIYCDMLIECLKNIEMELPAIGARNADKNIHTLINNAMEQLNGES